MNTLKLETYICIDASKHISCNPLPAENLATVKFFSSNGINYCEVTLSSISSSEITLSISERNRSINEQEYEHGEVLCFLWIAH